MHSFVNPQIDRIPLADGNWIDVKHELTAGEYRAMQGEMRRRFGPGEMPVLDPIRVGPARCQAYIVGWSLTDATGAPVPFSLGALDSLRVPRFLEIIRAIDTHEAAREEEAETEKKTIRNPEPTSDHGLRSVS
jgi:hypothetical protein